MLGCVIENKGKSTVNQDAINEVAATFDIAPTHDETSRGNCLEDPLLKERIVTSADFDLGRGLF